MALFGIRAGRPSADAQTRAAIVGWTRAAGGLDPEAVVKVNEIVCADPACPGTETVILVMVPGRPARAVKVAGPMEGVTEAEVASALAAP